mmetsp:Transcript_16673/g.40010  ORF Transcript_16673/g.40010 Transcript_16673/m.40010 type:complete len:326 (-) Transcript_16673:319-1296(-)
MQLAGTQHADRQTDRQSLHVCHESRSHGHRSHRQTESCPPVSRQRGDRHTQAVQLATHVVYPLQQGTGDGGRVLHKGRVTSSAGVVVRLGVVLFTRRHLIVHVDPLLFVQALEVVEDGCEGSDDEQAVVGVELLPHGLRNHRVNVQEPHTQGLRHFLALLRDLWSVEDRHGVVHEGLALLGVVDELVTFVENDAKLYLVLVDDFDHVTILDHGHAVSVTNGRRIEYHEHGTGTETLQLGIIVSTHPQVIEGLLFLLCERPSHALLGQHLLDLVHRSRHVIPISQAARDGKIQQVRVAFVKTFAVLQTDAPVAAQHPRLEQARDAA